ncbi:Avirulence (Avh) protein [Phytophthora megakarya]|uniref:RxLR effector protein n=1 Tax=Phytophthora megakarya TaxID=4795 RepID=A0A225WVZ1_9STRA|nr:Avirulence (Avh) protein [Phytophthora megakarya]
MRSVFYVAFAVAVLARTSFVAAFTNAEESQLLSKTIPDFATDTVINRETTKRFLRVTDPDDDVLTPGDEERVKIKKLSEILDKVAQAPKKVVESTTKFTKKELEAAAALLKLKDQ